MRELLKDRHTQLLAVFIVLAAILIIRLLVITVFQHNSWSDIAQGMTMKTTYSAGTRGEIYDRNGKLLAGNKQSFTVKMTSAGQDDKEMNETIIKLVDILNENGDDIESDFPIKKNGNKYYYTYESEIRSWLRSEDLDTDLTAEEAFEQLKIKLEIPKNTDRYEAQEIMQTQHNNYPPISVSSMRYSAEIDKEEFLESYGLETDSTAKEAYDAIKEYMEIPEDVSEDKAMDIVKIRNSINELGYNQYLSATVAKNVSDDTVMHVEEESEDLTGVEVVSESVRYYPNGSTASHILGYMGKISDSQLEEYADKGYQDSDIIGLQGIEGVYEDVLRGTNGSKTVQVNAYGDTERLVNETDPQKGKDVYLTIDLELQKATEDALATGISVMRYGGSFPSEYGNSPMGEAAPKAETGAAVVIDVDTGDVLAMASYPDYDPNLFAEGISDSDWERLQSDNPRDPLSPAPLYNIATRSTVQPGSTFKPVTATAALYCGLDPYETLVDGGYIMLDRSFGCVVWNLNKQTHGSLSLARAIGVSCNYYFYDISTGKDWYTGESLGYDKDISVDTITDFAEQYGLGLPTGIEIPESVVSVPTLESKVQNLKAGLSNELYAAAEDYFNKETVGNSRKLSEDIETIVSWVEKKDVEAKDILEELLPQTGAKKSKYDDLLDLCLYQYYNQNEWATGDAFNISIGQGENAYTPLQMANYIATLGNDGVHNEVSVVKSVEGQGLTQKKKGEAIDLDSNKLDYIIDGMIRVCHSYESTVDEVFNGIGFTVAGKTGTAERSGKINPASEVDYVKSHLSSWLPNKSWSDVRKEMNRLMKEYPDTYTNENTAVRRAVVNLSNGKVSLDDIDAYKSSYDPFAWMVGMAPAEDPEIAVAVMIPQGSTSANAAPILKEILCSYMDKEGRSTDDYKIEEGLN